MSFRQCFGCRKSVSSTCEPKFECLPNELILIIFDYLYCDEIIDGFSQLNSRFENLLKSYSSYYLKFTKQILELKLNRLKQLPLNINHVKSLILIDEGYCSISMEEILLPT